MAIKKVWIEDGCISCGLCESTCPEVFEMKETAVVKADAELDKEAEIKEAADGCPMEIIKFE